MATGAAAAAAAAAGTDDDEDGGQGDVDDELLRIFVRRDVALLTVRHEEMWKAMIQMSSAAGYVRTPMNRSSGLFAYASAADKVEWMQQDLLVLGRFVPEFWSPFSQRCHAWRFSALDAELGATFSRLMNNSESSPEWLRSPRNYTDHFRRFIALGCFDPTHAYSKKLNAIPGTPLVMAAAAASAAAAPSSSAAAAGAGAGVGARAVQHLQR